MTINISKKGKRVLYGAAALLLVAWLLFSNSFMAYFSGVERFKRCDLSQYPSKDKVMYALDAISYYEGVMEQLYIAAWAFCHTELDNQQRSLTVLLSNESGTWGVELEPNVDRPDILKVYREQRYVMSNPKVGVMSEITTVNLPNGIYQMSLFCKENEENYGLIDTNRFFKKENEQFSEWFFQSQKQSIAVPKKMEEQQVNSNMDSVTITNDTLVFNGWAFLKGVDAANVTTYLRLSSENNDMFVYTVQSYARPDVAKAFDLQYLDTGLKAVIPVDELEDGLWTAEIIGEFDGKYYCFAPYSLRKQAEQIELQKLK